MQTWRPFVGAFKSSSSSSSYASFGNVRAFSSKFNIQHALNEPEKLLLTPGPLSSSATVKQAMRRDFGSRDNKFIELVRSVRQGILDVEKLDSKEFTSILMQGSGTFAVESAITTCVPRETGKLLVISNGAYGDRAGTIAKYQNIEVEVLRCTEDSKPTPAQVDKVLTEHKKRGKPFSTVFMVHSETTSGLINPIQEVGELVKQKYGLQYIVDAMSSFGGIPIDFHACGIDFLVTSANKCLQGVPGFGIIVANRTILEKSKGNARSLSLDCHDQWKGLENNGQFRFTPPTHTICAFQQALDELKQEGGVTARMQRYKKNQKIVTDAILNLGFELYLNPKDCGHIITSIRYPKSKNWDFNKFYNKLAEHNFLIYPGKVTNADCFRIGHIGHVFPQDCERLAKALNHVSAEMNIFDRKI